MKRTLALVLTAIAVLSPSGAFSKECTRDEAYAAEVVTDYLNSWENVYLFYSQFGHCYDGAVAEGAEDKVQLLWADRWEDLPKMIALTNKNPEFRAFVWRVLQSEAFPQDTFARVLQNATRRCHQAAVSFCKEVKNAAKQHGA